MRTKTWGVLAACTVLATFAVAAWSEDAAKTPAVDQPASVLPNLNKLTRKEQREGWKLLFDGKTTNGWRNFKKTTISDAWKVIDGALCRTGAGAGDIVTQDQYANFELELDYKVPEDANSGVLYRVSEDHNSSWWTGPEFQLLDNANPNGDSQKSGWCYGLYKPADDPKTGKTLDATKPIGVWNHIKLVCDGPHVTHWMNGVKYVEYEIGSDDWNRRVAASKFGKMDGFAKNKKGYLVLQGDHGNVCFANIKIKELK